MTDLLNALQTALHSARKSQDKDRTLVLGTILSAVRNYDIELGRALTDDEVVTVLRRGVKQRREAAEQFEQAARPDLAGRERAQIRVIEEFLPAAVSADEIRAAVRAAIAGGASHLGAVMGAVMPRFQGRADGKEINRIAREELPAG